MKATKKEFKAWSKWVLDKYGPDVVLDCEYDEEIMKEKIIEFFREVKNINVSGSFLEEKTNGDNPERDSSGEPANSPEGQSSN